jgi:thioesterase domain-containing protein
MADYCTTKLMEAAFVGGAVEPDARDLVLLDSVVLAGAKCRDNREVLDRIARHLPRGHTKQMLDASVSQLRAEGDDYTRRAMEIRQAVLVDGVLNLHHLAGENELGVGDPATMA